MSAARLLLACIALSATASAIAGHFLPDPALDLRVILPPPPAADSLVTKAELDVVVQLQELRTPELAKRAAQIENETWSQFGADVVGPWLDPGNLPKTAALFAAVREDFVPINRASKALWPRKRPPYVDPRVKPCVEFSDTGAYPSGHGIQSALWAALFSELFPGHSAAFQKRAQETRRMKLFTGVHYPSDLEAGRVLGEAIAREMRKSLALQSALAEARAEIAAAHPR